MHTSIFTHSFQHDVEKIIHSKSFARYTDKTQVVYLVDNDHVTHRALHVQLVSFYARSLAKQLGLQEALVEAISLGHDMGHPPFGHEGEGYLSTIAQSCGLGAFSHSNQTCRLVSIIEPLDLSFEVLDGFLCHDGGMKERMVHIHAQKTFNDHLEERKMRLKEPERSFMPKTVEGALVKICDTVSYLGRDLEDAISLGIISRKEIPETILGTSNREILRVVGNDIIQNSTDQTIGLSEEIFSSLKILRRFNFERYYMHPTLKKQSQKIKDCYQLLFERLLEDLKKRKEKSYLFVNFLHSRNREYLDAHTDEQKVVDFIAGMTDRYFISTVEALIVPQKIKLCTAS
jgi:dGTPase